MRFSDARFAGGGASCWSAGARLAASFGLWYQRQVANFGPAALQVLRRLGSHPTLAYVVSDARSRAVIAAFWKVDLAQTFRRARPDADIAIVSVAVRDGVPVVHGTTLPIEDLLEALAVSPDAPMSIALAVWWNTSWDDEKRRVWVDESAEEIVWWGAFHPRSDSEYEDRQSIDDFLAHGSRASEPVTADVLERVRAHLARVGARPRSDEQELLRASSSGELESVTEVLARGVSPSAHDRRGKLALAVAIERFHFDVALALVRAGADPERCLAGASWCLFVAATRGAWPLAEALLERGAQRTDETALARAVALGAPLELVERLRAAGPAPRLAHPAWRDAAIRARAGSDPAIAAWIETHLGSLPDPPPPPVAKKPSPPKETRLHEAVRGGDIARLTQLLREGLAVDGRDWDDRTPLMRATEAPAAAQAALVDALVGAGANREAKDRSGATALVKGVRRGAREAVRALAKHGADPNALDERTPALVWAARSNDPEMIGVLLHAGADRGRRDDHGLTALDHAKRNKNAECTALLSS